MRKAQQTPRLYKGEHRYDVSYSGLKTAVINQLEQFRALPKQENREIEEANIAASFQRTAVEILAKPLFNAVEDTGLHTIVADIAWHYPRKGRDFAPYRYRQRPGQGL